MEFTLVHELTDRQVRELVDMYQKEWWSRGRKPEDVKTMLKHSNEIFVLTDTATGGLAGLARVLTDYVYKALISDVMVAEEYRGRGLGRFLMDAICTHPPLRSVRHMELYCLPEMVPLYQKWGFTSELGELRFLRWNRN